jgi:hypothetical protein
MFPTVKFNIAYADEDFGYNLAEYGLKDGIEYKRYNPEEGSADAYRLAFKVRAMGDGHSGDDEGIADYITTESVWYSAEGTLDEFNNNSSKTKAAWEILDIGKNYNKLSGDIQKMFSLVYEQEVIKVKLDEFINKI